MAEIAWTPWDIVIEKIAEKVEIGRFYAFLYTKNAVFLHKKLKNDLELIEGHPTRFLEAEASNFWSKQFWSTSVD